MSGLKNAWGEQHRVQFELEVNAGRRQFETRGVQKVRHSAKKTFYEASA
jgi:hypothetical protein